MSRVVVATPVAAVAAVGVAAPIVAVAASGIAVTVAVIAVGVFEVAAVVIASIESANATIVAVSTASVVVVVPRAGADEDAADKVVRAVEAIRRTFVGVIIIVSVGANGSYADVAVARADTNANGNLSMGIACGKQEDAQ